VVQAAIGRSSYWLPLVTILAPDAVRGAVQTTLFDCVSRLYDLGAGSMVFDGRPLASFVKHELASLGIARDCFKRPAPI
jgi:ABC-type branched-subunit amino acid transport system ATPase component